MSDQPIPPGQNPDAGISFRDILGRTAGCFDVEVLADAQRNPGGHPEVQRHLDACNHCRTELALMQAFENAEPDADELASLQWMESELRGRSRQAPGATPAELPQVPSAWERWRTWIGGILSGPNRSVMALAAASLLIAVGACVYLRRPADGPAATHPGDNLVWRSTQFAALSPAGDIAAAPSQFQWEAAPGAAGYRVEITEVDGTMLWSGNASQTSIAVPLDILSQLKPGRAFRWKVTAFDAAGAKIAGSDLQTFHILVTSR